LLISKADFKIAQKELDRQEKTQTRESALP
jgi:hypothetical protein